MEAVIKSIHSWNGRRAEAEGVILLPRHWKSDAVPLVNPNGAQRVIDSQLVDSVDIVIAVFDSRLGQATEDAVSGTAHEIERTSDAGKPVHVYFSDEPISRKADPKELARLNKFREEMQAKSLLGLYADPTDLGYQVREAIEHDLTQMDLGVAALPVAAPVEHAMPRLRYDDYAKRLIVENLSTSVGATQLTLEIPEGAYRIDYDGEPVDLIPQAEARWRVILFLGSDDSVKITMRWLEDGEPHEETQTVFLD
ncbi:hypothetical protein [Mycobacterium canetti]|uniref:hypothetical protein n=1 Tax=Mycobacterium canetti TaxID=78331 RepID=UPI0002A58A16|nr:hypothetical protein [Mycobacterium canetti]CCK60112.1 Conserved protein of unknown function [Mycobacterium canettii CIPT 140070010]